LICFRASVAFSLGLERTGGFETVAFCEIEPFPRKVLAKHWPDVPCFEDVRKLTRDDIDGSVDVICGGYPCQPFSTAGRRLGKEDDRHLWPEFARLVEEFRPTWVIGENVAGHISMGLDDVLSDLERLGYAARPFVIPAVAVDAKHRRDRIWIVGYPNESGKSCSPINAKTPVNAPLNGGNDANAKSRQQQMGRVMARIGRFAERVSRDGIWEAENSPLGMGVDDGLPRRLDRLRALGNAVVPQIPEMIGYAILEAEREFA